MLNLGAVFDQFPVLETERLVLRQQQLSDAQAIFALFSDAEAMRENNMTPIETLDQAYRLIDGAHAQYTHQQVIRWGIALKESDALIGACGCLGFKEHNASTELGYDLLRAHWNQGYMTEALRAVVRFCFETVSVNRLEAMTTLGNLASMRVLVKLGFREEGVLRDYGYWQGAYHDLRMYVLLRRDYDKPSDL